MIASLSTFFSEVEVLGMFDSERPRVVVVPATPQPGRSLVAAVADADLVIAGGHHQVDAQVIAGMRRCRLIQFPGAGVDTVDLDAAARRGIPVANAAGLNRDSVADWTLMAILNLVRGGAWSDRGMRRGAWSKVTPLPPDLGALTVGILGLGNIGTAVAARLQAFGARVLYHDPVARRLAGAEPVAFARLLADSDVLTVHVPLQESTRHLLGPAELAAMKPGAILVNASRGPVLDEVAALAALRAGRLGGLGLDVFETEPLPADSPLRREERVFLTPHIAGSTSTTAERLLKFVGENLRRAAAGRPPLNVVNGVEMAARGHAR